MTERSPDQNCGKTSDDEHGRTLHRELVGMLFALAIAEVAVEASTVVNAQVAGVLTNDNWIASYSHLLLAFAFIVASWVGWGRSASSLSNVKTIFSMDCIELVIDLVLVAFYIFLTKGAELPAVVGQITSITPSVQSEILWGVIIFVTYALWDLWTKIIDGHGLARNSDKLWLYPQRGWASLLCAILALGFWFYWSPAVWKTTEVKTVLQTDCALLLLALAFRAMKIADLYKIRWAWLLIAVLMSATVVFALGATKNTPVGMWLDGSIQNLL